MNKRFRLYVILICVAFVFVAFISIAFGQVWIPLKEIFSHNLSEQFRSILLQIRLPRFLLSASVGAMLSIAGLVVQTIFRNPLVDPYFLGISAASELGVSVAIIIGASATIFGVSIASAFAFLFAVVLIFILTRISMHVSLENSKSAIVLIGIAISYVLSAFNNFISIFKKDVFLESTFWGLKGFNNASINQFLFSFPFLIGGFVYLFLNAKKMNIYLSSDITAHSLGINLKHFTASMLIISALLTAVSVVVSGTIIFVGLFVPHIGRMLAGDERKKLLLITVLIGSTVMPLFDFIARTVIPLQEIPINIIASLVGAPFFIYLFFKTRNDVPHIG